MTNQVEGFKTIPGFKKYVINKDGVLKSVVGNKIINWHKSNGYIFCSIVDDIGRRRSVGQHRLLASAFIEKPNVSELLEVNHIDGCRSNNTLNNLEWATKSKNQKHAYDVGLNKYGIQTVVTDQKTGVAIEFPTKRRACAYYGWDVANFVTVAKERKCLYDGYLVEFSDDSDIARNIVRYEPGLVARNIYTKQIVITDTLGELEKITGVERKVIKRILAGKRFTYPVNGYDIRILSKDIVWPVYTEEELKAFEGMFFIHNPTIVIDSQNNESLFGSVLLASAFTGTHERAIRFCVKNKTVCKNG